MRIVLLILLSLPAFADDVCHSELCYSKLDNTPPKSSTCYCRARQDKHAKRCWPTREQCAAQPSPSPSPL